MDMSTNFKDNVLTVSAWCKLQFLTTMSAYLN